MRKKSLFTTAIIMVTLLSVNIMPAARPLITGAAPPLPVSPTATLLPAGLDTDQPPHTPPPPGVFPPEVEQARARQAIQAVLEKHLRYWGPRYQTAPIEVKVEGEWALGIAQWQSETKALSSPIHILAHRLPDGTWQALMPGSEGLYLQWLGTIPESLVPAGEKGQLRAQAAEADALRKPQSTPAVPPAITVSQNKERVGEPVELLPEPIQPTFSEYNALISDSLLLYSPSVLDFNIQTFLESAGGPLSRYSERVEGQLWTAAEIIQYNAMLFGINPQVILIMLESENNLITDADAQVPMESNSQQNQTDTAKFYYHINRIARQLLTAYDSRRYHKSDESVQFSTSKSLPVPKDLNAGTYSVQATLAQILPIDQWYLWVQGSTPVFTQQFARWFENPLLDPDSKNVQLATLPEGYILPFPIGETWYYTGGPHTYDSSGARPWSSIDMAQPEHISCPGGSYPEHRWVVAAKGGTVIYSSQALVIIDHGDGWRTYYSHIATPDRRGKGGINQGDHVGHPSCEVEPGGKTSGVHVHFAIWQAGVGFVDISGSSLSGWLIQETSHYNGTMTRNGITRWADTSRTNGYNDIYNYGYTSDDTTPPDGDITSPSEGATVSSRIVHLAGWAQDNAGGSGFNHAHFTAYYDGSWRQVGPDFTSSPFGLDWDMCNDSVPNGPVTIGLDIWDNAGNQANSPHGVRHFTKSYDCSPPPSCNPNADQVALFVDSNYGGQCVVKNIGEYPNSGSIGLPNDSISSVKVGGNVRAILCEHDNYGGVCEAFTNDDPNLGDNGIGNDRVSSIKVEQRAQPPAVPVPQAPANGYTYDEGAPVNLAWTSTGNEYYGEVWGGPGGTLTFGWQSTTYKSLGAQWAGYAYSWHVKARNGAGESGWSDTWTFTVKPATPSNLSAQTASCSAVNLYWTDNSGSEEGYKIYRNGSYIGQVEMNTTSYQDTGLSENTGYSYYVKAFRGSIESDASNTVNIATPSCAPPQPDLRPSQWSGWQYPVVPSSITGTNQVNTLYAGYPTYIDWGLTNYGDADTGGNTYGALYIDDVQIGYYDFGDVQAGWTWAFFDWEKTVETPGWHTLKSVADPDDLIAESDEGNNVFQWDFYWIASAPYADDMESGTNDWTATGLWHQVDASSPYSESHSMTHSWWYGQDSTGNYDTGAANSGDLTSPPTYIPDTGYYLRFWYRYETETQGSYWDQRWVQISVDDGPFNNVLQLYDGPMNWWLQSPVIDLSGYAGHTIRVRFHFDTLDADFNDYRGWYIDDFEISTTPPPSCADTHEPNDTPAEAAAIAYGQTLNADICPGGDYDFYTFTGNAGDKVVVDIDAEGNGSLLDSYVYLLGSDGTSALAENDDEIIADVHDSHLGYQLPYTGTYYIKVKAWNHPSAGGTDYFYTIHLLTDDASPTAEITSPDHYDWLDPDLQTITTDVSDSESGIRNVTFYWHDADWDNSDWIVIKDDHDPRDGWTYDFDTSAIPEQSQGCVVFIYAYDWAGNYAGYGSYSLGIDRTPPTVAASVYPTYGDAPFRDFWVDWGNGLDNLSGIAGYDVQYRDGPGVTWTDLLTDTTDTHYRFVGQDGHTYYFRVRARDYAGNQSTYAGGDGDAQYTVNICDVAPDAYEADDTANSAGWITTDGISQTHNIHAEGDQDWAKFYAAAGVTYTLVTTNTGGHADTVLYLYGTDGSTLIDSNDDYPGMWPASRLDWQPSASGTYYTMVNHWDEYAYGCTTRYGLTILTNDTTPPTGNVSVNNGAAYVASRTVMLNLVGTDVGTGVGQMMVSNNSSFSGATWVSYVTSLDWTLTSGDGTKTVYVRFRDRAGNVSGIYSDTIVLDTIAPTGSIIIQSGTEVVTQTQVVLTLNASDANGVTYMRLRNDSAAWGTWEPFSTSRIWTLPVQPGERIVWVQFRDPVGNVSTAYSDSIVYQFPYRIQLPLIMRDFGP